MMRGSRAAVTLPQVADSSVAPMPDRFVWLNVLNVSLRICNPKLSLKAKFLNSESAQVW